MALISYTGFDQIKGLSDLYSGPFNSGTTTNGFSNRLGTGRFSGNSVQFYNATSGTLSNASAFAFKSFGSTLGTAIIGFAFKDPFLNLSLINGVGFYKNGTCQIHVHTDLSGVLFVRRGTPSYDSPATLLASCNPISSINGWNYMEIKATIATGTGGSIQIRINGVQILNLTSVNTSSDGTAQTTDAGFFCRGSGGFRNFGSTTALFDIDDIYLADTTGSAPYNTFLGDVSVFTKFPTSNGSHTDFTPLASTNVSQINETAMDSFVTYNSNTTAGLKDSFTSSTSLGYSPTVYAVQSTVAAATNLPASRSLAGIVRSGSTESIGSGTTLGTAIGYINQTTITDPNTSTAWTPSAVDSAEVGYTIIS